VPIMKTVKFKGATGNFYQGIIVANLTKDDYKEYFVKIIFRFDGKANPFAVILKNKRTDDKMRVDIGGFGTGCGGRFEKHEKGPAQIEIDVAQSCGVETDDIIRFFIEFGKLLEELLKDIGHDLYDLGKNNLRRWTSK